MATIMIVCTAHNTWTTCHSAKVLGLPLSIVVLILLSNDLARYRLHLSDGKGLQADSYLQLQEEAEDPA